MKLEYDFTQLSKAAKYLWKKNPVYRVRGQSVGDVKNLISKDLMRYAFEVKHEINKDQRFLSTGGYTIILFQEDKDSGLIAEILIDASVAVKDHDFMTVDV